MGGYSLTGKFEVEGGQADGEGLKDGAWEGDVHVEVVLAHASELHVNVVVVVLVYQLKILHACLVDPPVEVEHEGLHLLIPLGGLVEEEHYVLRVILPELLANRLVRLHTSQSICTPQKALTSLLRHCA